MALFEYFPNYIWNLSLSIAIASGGEIGEIIDMCKPLKDAADGGADVGTGAFLAEWVKMADKLAELADEDAIKNRRLSAANKWRRAALYYLTAERMQGRGDPVRAATFGKAQTAFRRYIDWAQENCERREIPYLDKSLPALYTRAERTSGPAPCVLYVNGLDSCKELLYWSGLPKELARRGISTLCVDQPGTGESLRLNRYPATYEAETWASPCVDWMVNQTDIDHRRLGMVGISLGGYFTPRAVAFEPRFASGAAWGGNHNWAEVQTKRLRREGENPVPHYWSHVMWVFGAQDMQDFAAKSKGMDLTGVLHRIQVPFLVTHGARDRQIALEYAQQTYDQLTNSPRRELKIFTDREGGVEHVGADNMAFGRDYIADWFAETLA